MKKIITLCLFLMSTSVFALSCNNAKQKISFNENIKGIVLIVHGLNFNPQKMEALGNYYNSQNIAPLYVKLTGHTEETNWKQVSSDRWIKDFYTPLCQAYLSSKDLGIPLYGLGYSLGAVLIQHSIERFDVPYKSVTYIAPAFKTRWYSAFITMLFRVGFEFNLPSGNFVEYRAKSDTGLLAYKAMWDLTNILSYSDKIPKTILMDARDEVIDFYSTRDLCKEWSACTLVELRSKPSRDEKSIFHLAVDSTTLGQKMWKKLTSKISLSL